jgi:hypothetical protein
MSVELMGVPVGGIVGVVTTPECVGLTKGSLVRMVVGSK